MCLCHGIPRPWPWVHSGWRIPELNRGSKRKITNGLFSIAMFDYRRVSNINDITPGRHRRLWRCHQGFFDRLELICNKTLAASSDRNLSSFVHIFPHFSSGGLTLVTISSWAGPFGAVSEALRPSCQGIKWDQKGSFQRSEMPLCSSGSTHSFFCALKGARPVNSSRHPFLSQAVHCTRNFLQLLKQADGTFGISQFTARTQSTLEVGISHLH